MILDKKERRELGGLSMRAKGRRKVEGRKKKKKKKKREKKKKKEIFSLFQVQVCDV